MKKLIVLLCVLLYQNLPAQNPHVVIENVKSPVGPCQKGVCDVAFYLPTSLQDNVLGVRIQTLTGATLFSTQSPSFNGANIDCYINGADTNCIDAWGYNVSQPVVKGIPYHNTSVANQTINLRLSIHPNSPSDSIQYSETTLVTTDNTGGFSTTVGVGASNTPGNSWNTINWNNVNYLVAEIDVTGGGTFIPLNFELLNNMRSALFRINGLNPGQYLIEPFIHHFGNIQPYNILPSNMITIFPTLTSGNITVQVDSIHLPTDGCTTDGYFSFAYSYDGVTNSDDYRPPILTTYWEGKADTSANDSFPYYRSNFTNGHLVAGGVSSHSLVNYQISEPGFNSVLGSFPFLAPAPVHPGHPQIQINFDYPLKENTINNQTTFTITSAEECISQATYHITGPGIDRMVISPPGNNGHTATYGAYGFPLPVTRNASYHISATYMVGGEYQARYGPYFIVDTIIQGPDVIDPCDGSTFFSVDNVTTYQHLDGKIHVYNGPTFYDPNDPTWTAYLYPSDTTLGARASQHGNLFDNLSFENLEGGKYWVKSVYTKTDGSNNPDGICEKWIGPITVLDLNDNVCNPIYLSMGLSGPFSNVAATTEVNEPHPPQGNCTGQMGWCSDIDQTVWFYFIAPPSGKLTIHRNPNLRSWDSQMALYKASSCNDILNGNYILVAANDDFNNGMNASLGPLDLVPGANYWLQVDGRGNTEESNWGLWLEEPTLVADIRIDTVLGKVIYVPLEGAKVKAYYQGSATPDDSTLTDVNGQFNFTHLLPNRIYTLKIHYTASEGIGQQIYSDYEYPNYKISDAVGTIGLPYSMLLQVRRLLNTIREKPDYEITYAYGWLDPSTLTDESRPHYDVAEIDTLINHWRSIDKTIAKDVVDNLGRVYIATKACDLLSNNAYELSKIPGKSLSEFAIAIIDLGTFSDLIKKIANDNASSSFNKFGIASKFLGEIAAATLSFSLKSAELITKKISEQSKTSEAKKIFSQISNTIKETNSLLKKMPDAGIDIYKEAIKDLLNNSIFKGLYSYHLNMTQDQLHSIAQSAGLQIPPGSSFESAARRVLLRSYPSLIDSASNTTSGAIVNAASFLDSGDKLKLGGEAFKLLNKIGDKSSIGPTLTLDFLNDLQYGAKDALAVLDACKLLSYASAYMVGVDAFCENMRDEFRVPRLSFSPDLPTPSNRNTVLPLNRVLRSSTAPYLDSLVTFYNANLDSVITLIQNHSDSLAIVDGIQLLQQDSVLDRTFHVATVDISATAGTAQDSIAGFDALYFHMLDDFNSSITKRKAVALGLFAWTLDTVPSSLFIDTLVQYANDAKQNNNSALQSFRHIDSITAGLILPLHVMITYIDGQEEVNKGDTSIITISYTNYGTDTAHNATLIIHFTSGFQTPSDTLFIGDIPPGTSGSLPIPVLAPQTDVISVYNLEMKLSNGEGDFESDVIETKNLEICNNNIDDDYDGLVDEGCTSILNLKLFIEGLYIGKGKLQPLLQNCSVLNDSSVADFITVELHDAVQLDSIYYMKKIYLHTDGTATLFIPSELWNRSYYIVIHHRNSLETWSKNPFYMTSENHVLNLTEQ